MARTKLSLSKRVKLSPPQLLLIGVALAALGIFYVWKTYAASCPSSSCGTALSIYGNDDKLLMGARVCKKSGRVYAFVRNYQPGTYSAELFDSGGNSVISKRFSAKKGRTYSFVLDYSNTLVFSPPVKTFSHFMHGTASGNGNRSKSISSISTCKN